MLILESFYKKTHTIKM